MFTRLVSAFPALVCLLLSSACTTRQASKTQPPQPQAHAPSDTGIVVFSVTHDLGGGPNTKSLIYIDEPKVTGWSHYASTEKPIVGFRRDNDFQDVLGYLNVVTLPAGKHSFRHWQITDGAGRRIFPNSALPQLNFEVLPGEVVYLGSFHASLAYRTNFLGVAHTVDGFIEVVDARDRDLPLFATRYPQLAGQVRNVTLYSGPWPASPGTSTRQDPLPILVR